MTKVKKISDPRLKRGFRPELWPLCNGEPAPAPGTSGQFEHRCLEFLAAFYRLNVLNMELLARRKSGTAAARRQALARIKAATLALEKLEDDYAPVGFFGEPVMEGILYRNVIFVRPKPPKIYSQEPKQSACFKVPGLEDIPEVELHGTPTIVRLGREKVDS